MWRTVVQVTHGWHEPRSWRTVALLVTPLVLILLSILTVSPANAQTTTGSFVAAPTFTTSGLAFVVFTGGTVAQLETAARGSGASGVWAQDTTGALQLLVVGGPTFLTEPFRARFSNGFFGATALTLTRDPGGAAAPTPPAATASPTPPPAATPTPTPKYPQAGAPSRSIAIHGDLRTDSMTQFAYDFNYIDTLPAIRAGASIPEQEVTYVRACR